jgi:hypothetical protein
MFIALFGAASFVLWNATSETSWWALDLRMLLDAGARYLAGQPLYTDPKFLYPPAAAIVAAPLSLLDPVVVSVVYALVKLGLVGLCVAWATRGWQPAHRALAVIGVATCLPFAHDVMLGNVNALLVAAAFVALLTADRPRAGIALGVVAALFAKPLLVPILLLLVVRRRRTALGAVVAGLSVTVVSMVLAGPAEYLAWVQALRAGAQYASPFAGNHGVTALAPALWLPVALVVGVGLVWAVFRGPVPTAVTWAVTSGILLAPYAGTYAALPVVLALPFIGPAMPVAALLIAALSPVATTYLLPFYAAAILVVGVQLGRRPANNRVA